jgi:hypothetical protein
MSEALAVFFEQPRDAVRLDHVDAYAIDHERPPPAIAVR